MNSPSALIGTTVEQASQVINGWGFMITPEALSEIAKDVGEASILSRAGGTYLCGGYGAYHHRNL